MATDQTSRDLVCDDLETEYRRLDAILVGLTNQQWEIESGAPGWTVHDVVIHLATTEEGVPVTLQTPTHEWHVRDRPLDAVVHDQVRAINVGHEEAFDRWRAATIAALAALRSADPSQTVRWAAAPLRPRTLATTRLAEHWAHALDICEPLGIALPDTDRLRHIAWLGHATLPYAFRLADIEPFPVRCRLEAPDGQTWDFGPANADARVTGSAGAFCRVGARRLAGAASGLTVSGPDAASALQVLRNYAA